MVIKPRTESLELRLLRCLNARMELPPQNKQLYLNLEKGFEGEIEFDKLITDLPGEWLLLNGLTFEKNNTIFQIDSLLISHSTCYLFEIKN